MQIALLTTFVASRKEPLVEVLERIHAALVAADFGEPHIQFVLADPSVGGVSSVARVLKRFPQLEKFVQDLAPFPAAIGATRAISNRTSSGAEEEKIDFAILLNIARGVPRSFPFHSVRVHFSVPTFSGGMALPSVQAQLMPGIDVSDSWWVNGRMRSVTALTFVDADPTAKKLPKLPDSVAAVLAACGKVKKTIQVPLVNSAIPQRPNLNAALDAAAPDVAQAIRNLVNDYRARLPEILERAKLPHDLPPNSEALATTSSGVTAGPRKPALMSSFAPMGYDCRGESGTFTLRRRTQSNLTEELMLDVGTWGHNIMAIFRILGMVNGAAFKASVILPVARRATTGGQYPIGGPERWHQIVENLAALVAELDSTFVPAIEALSGPSPDWYKPESQ